MAHLRFTTIHEICYVKKLLSQAVKIFSGQKKKSDINFEPQTSPVFVSTILSLGWLYSSLRKTTWNMHWMCNDEQSSVWSP